MKTSISVLTLFVLGLVMTSCDSSLTENAGPAINENSSLSKTKVFICHVGNELPEYDPACDPETETCGDAGKIDLIEVADVAADQHLSNTSHCYDGVCDYLPTGDVGAADAKEDTDGNYIDEACEEDAEISCPCFDASDLTGGVCGTIDSDGAQYNRTPFPKFHAEIGSSGPYCSYQLAPGSPTSVGTSQEVAEYCYSLIEDECE